MQKEKIEEMIGRYKGRVIDLCYKIVDEMENESFEDQVQTLENFCDVFGVVAKTGEDELPVYINGDRLNEMVASYGTYVNTLLATALSKAYRENMDKRSFYRMLWDGIVKTDLLSGIEEKTFGFYYIVIDRGVPYYQLGHGITMNDEDYRRLQTDNWETIRKMRFILQQKFSQRTEEASLLLKELELLDDRKARAAVFASILSTIRDNEAERVKNQRSEQEEER